MRLGARAVVLGGSVAGLCAAGAVAGYFDEVVVIERDVLPDAAEHRRGVPQSRHPHFLLNSGRRAIEAIFPGYEKDLIAAGGRVLMPSMGSWGLDMPRQNEDFIAAEHARPSAMHRCAPLTDSS